jgi:hypothetical protein
VGPTGQPPRAAPGPRGSTPLPHGRHVPRQCCGLKPLSGQRAARPDSCHASPAPRPTAAAPPASRPHRARRLRPNRSPRSRRRPDRRGPKPPTPGPTPSRAAHRPSVAVAPRRRVRADEPPFPRRLPCAGADPLLTHRAAPPPSHAPPGSAVACSCPAPRVARADRAGPPAPRTWAAHDALAEAVGHASGPRRALCIWAERRFGPEALKLIFLFSDLFNSLQMQKFV